MVCTTHTLHSYCIEYSTHMRKFMVGTLQLEALRFEEETIKSNDDCCHRPIGHMVVT